jgi:hypothetical protein
MGSRELAGPMSLIRTRLAHEFEYLPGFRGRFELWGGKWVLWCTKISPEPGTSPIFRPGDAPRYSRTSRHAPASAVKPKDPGRLRRSRKARPARRPPPPEELRNNPSGCLTRASTSWNGRGLVPRVTEVRQRLCGARDDARDGARHLSPSVQDPPGNGPRATDPGQRTRPTPGRRKCQTRAIPSNRHRRRLDI